MDIGARKLGPEEPCFIIAEVGLQHDGSVRQAHAYIDAVAEAGADAVKFQCHHGDPVEGWRVAPEWISETRQEYWKRTGFTPLEWFNLAVHARSVGIEFMCSPFSVPAVLLLERLVPAWKIPSGLIGNWPVLEAVADTEKPVLLSTGMATDDETDRARDFLEDRGLDVLVMQCTSEYPCPAEHVGLWEAAACGGLSDHSGTIWAVLGAVALGIRAAEVHVCWNRGEAGFDVESSITVDELRRLCEGARFIERAKGPVSKDKMAEELAPMRELFMHA